MTKAEKLVDTFRKWEASHNRDNYGRYDAFKAGHASRDEEVRELEEKLKISVETLQFYALISDALEDARMVSGSPAREALKKIKGDNP